MPQLKFKGVKLDSICAISESMVSQISELISCPKEHFTVEHISTSFIREGQVVEGYPLIEIAWFDRGQELQDKVALIVTEELKKVGYPECDIFFTLFNKTSYYENGKHF